MDRSTGEPILAKNVKVLENRFAANHWYSFKTSGSSENTDLEPLDYKHDWEIETEVLKPNSSDSARGSVTESQLESLKHYLPQRASNQEGTPVQNPIIHLNLSRRYPSRERNATSFFEPSMVMVGTTELEPSSIGEVLHSSEAMH